MLKTRLAVSPPTAFGSAQSCIGLIPAPRMPPTQRLGSTTSTLHPSCFAATAARIPAGVPPYTQTSTFFAGSPARVTATPSRVKIRRAREKARGRFMRNI